MRQSKADIYLHFVWSTKQRDSTITPKIATSMDRCIEMLAQEMRCTVLGLGGIPNHRHLLLKTPTILSASTIMQTIKGTSSHFIRDNFPNEDNIYWQPGYGVFSVSRSHLKQVVSYIKYQPQHHATNKLWPEWEETSIEVEL